jgi:hypothetical protein
VERRPQGLHPARRQPQGQSDAATGPGSTIRQFYTDNLNNNIIYQTPNPRPTLPPYFAGLACLN